MVTWSLAPVDLPHMLVRPSTCQVTPYALVTAAGTLPLKFLASTWPSAKGRRGMSKKCTYMPDLNLRTSRRFGGSNDKPPLSKRKPKCFEKESLRPHLRQLYVCR